MPDLFCFINNPMSNTEILMNNNEFLHEKALLFMISHSITQKLGIKKPETVE